MATPANTSLRTIIIAGSPSARAQATPRNHTACEEQAQSQQAQYAGVVVEPSEVDFGHVEFAALSEKTEHANVVKQLTISTGERHCTATKVEFGVDLRRTNGKNFSAPSHAVPIRPHGTARILIHFIPRNVLGLFEDSLVLSITLSPLSPSSPPELIQIQRPVRAKADHAARDGGRDGPGPEGGGYDVQAEHPVGGKAADDAGLAGAEEGFGGGECGPCVRWLKKELGPLTYETYGKYWSTLLQAGHVQEELDMRNYDMEGARMQRGNGRTFLLDVTFPVSPRSARPSSVATGLRLAGRAVPAAGSKASSSTSSSPRAAPLDVQFQGSSIPARRTLLALSQPFPRVELVVVTTTISASILSGVGLPRGHFSHIFVDEAGQSTEPSTFLPLSLAGDKTSVILAGDPNQLGPVIRSPISSQFGLSHSLLSRLMSLPLYSPSNHSLRGTTYTLLTQNYRNHPSILHLRNLLFYANELVPRAPAKIANASEDWKGWPGKGFPLVSHAVKGRDEREGSSPSFFDVGEMSVVRNVVEGLRAKKSGARVRDQDIGVINFLQRPAEEAQAGASSRRRRRDGREVPGFRASHDTRFALGFLSSPARLNVALTRAQAGLIVVGDPDLLALDPLWRKLQLYIHDGRGWEGQEWDAEAWREEDGKQGGRGGGGGEERKRREMDKFVRRFGGLGLEGPEEGYVWVWCRKGSLVAVYMCPLLCK
ncbi:hypothetical protein JCM8547_004841 [Rhodosporidiobolus lusitaniae]